MKNSRTRPTFSLLPGLVILLSASFAGALAAAKVEYTLAGVEVDPRTVSRIQAEQQEAYLSRYNARIVQIDGLPTHIVVRPGEHVFSLTYQVVENLLFPGRTTVNQFVGHYDVTVRTQPGMLYAPTILHTNGEPDLARMCVIEVAQSKQDLTMKEIKAIRAAQKAATYVACGTPSVPPDSAFELCRKGEKVVGCYDDRTSD